MRKAKPETPVINHPDVYNIYHEEYTFRALKEAGVNVPREEFSGEDIGKTLVVYKPNGKHGSPKLMKILQLIYENFDSLKMIWHDE
ncbi:MAG: hypothetical protein AB1480_00225 [Nitrospirota bacterium]